jgi:homoserine kinase
LKKQEITVRVPATTSNLGPGFDCLGVALRIYNFVSIAPATAEKPNRMMQQAAAKFFKTVQQAPFPFSCNITGDVPQARGLGSSVTVRLGVLHGLNALLDFPLGRAQIFRLCAELEGHPDNAAPAEFGGFVVARAQQLQKFPVRQRLRFVLLIPPFPVETKKARAVLPNEIDRRRAIASCGNACALTAAMTSGRYENLRGTMSDHLHQPYRAKFVPFLDRVIAAAEEAGALGGFLSGSGSTIIALTLRTPERIADAMLAASGLSDAEIRITTADNNGSRHTISHAPLA